MLGDREIVGVHSVNLRTLELALYQNLELQLESLILAQNERWRQA